MEDLVKLMVDKNPVPHQRKLLPTQRRFIFSHDFLEAYMGPAGCAKTSTGCAKILLRALTIPGSKWFVARRDYNDLKDTTMRTMATLLSRLPEGTLVDRVQAAPAKWYIRPIATTAEGANAPLSEITFMGLSDDVGSYEFTGGFIDETDEVEVGYFEQMIARLRYWPEGMEQVPTDQRHSIWMAFNPPSVAHWLYEKCTGMDEAGEYKSTPTIKLYRPQPDENEANLPEGYYERMVQGMTQDLAKRLREGEWGNTFPGQPVIRQFRRALHVKRGLKYAGGTLFRFWDFGYRVPVCLFAQVSRMGQVQILKELRGQNVTAEKFAEQVLQLTKQWFPTAQEFEDYGDPAVKQQKDTGQALAILHNAGILMHTQRTPLDISLNACRKRFESQIEGEQAILIDASCRVLCDALAGGYHLKDDGVTPHKDNVYDHSVDAMRYGIWMLFGATRSSTDMLPVSIAYSADGAAEFMQ
jgi:hypothetical protein